MTRLQEEISNKFDALYEKLEADGLLEKYNEALDELSWVVEELMEEYNELEEEAEYLRENQKEFNPYSEYGVSESDFH